MIQLTTVEAMARAIENARAAQLFVKPTSLFRQYTVENRANGQSYTVDFFIRNGRRFGHCTCKAGVAGKVVCKHIAAASGLHVMRAAEQAMMKMAA
jgi:uncharacterized Zn finger protein